MNRSDRVFVGERLCGPFLLVSAAPEMTMLPEVAAKDARSAARR